MPEQPKPTVAATVLSTLTGEALGRASLLVLTFFAANRLGTSLYGKMGVLVAAASLLQPVSDLGISAVALRSLSGEGGKERLPLLLRLKAGATLAFLAFLLAWGAIVERGFPSVGFLLAGAMVLATNWGDFLRQCLRAFQLAPSESRARLLFAAGCVASAVLLSRLPRDPTSALLCLSIPPFVLCAAYAKVLLTRVGLSGPTGEVRRFLSENRSLLAGTVTYLFLVVSIMRLDVWLANHFLGVESIGVWLSAYNMIYAGAFLAQGLASVAVPRLMDPESRPERVLWKVWRLQAGLAAAMALGVAVAGPLVFRLIYRAPGFSRALEIIPLLGLLLASSTLATLAYNLFLVSRRVGTYLVLMVPAVLAKFCIACILVPRLGLRGMAFSSLLSEGGFTLVTTLVGSLFYLRWRRCDPKIIPS